MGESATMCSTGASPGPELEACGLAEMSSDKVNYN